MLLEETPKEFRENFLLMFVKEMIENTQSYHQSKIREEVKEFEREKEKRERKIEEIRTGQKEEIKEIVRERIKEDFRKVSEMERKGLTSELKLLSRPFQAHVRKIFPKRIPPLKIQEPMLPATVSYLKPVATHEEIDLGKLNALIHDPLVKIIECNGPDENVFVIGIMGRKPTAIKLSKEETEETVGKFASISKIPVHEGLFKAAVGSLVMSAVISEIVGIKFVVRKISLEPRYEIRR